MTVENGAKVKTVGPLSDAEFFHMLWQADWSAADIAAGYGETEDHVRSLLAGHWQKIGMAPEAGA